MLWLLLPVLTALLLSRPPGVLGAGQWRIRHGSLARAGQFPSILMLSSKTSLCTASIIGPSKVLTAGHCVCSTKNMKWVFVDTLSNTRGWDFSKKYDIDRFEVNPGYSKQCRERQKGGYGGVSGHDMAMITIRGRFRFDGQRVKQGRISYRQPSNGDRMTLAGFGLDGSGQSGTLRFGSITVLKCPTKDPSLAFAICYDYSEAVNRQVTLSGDSGGPMYNGQGEIVGVTSGNVNWSNGPNLGVHSSCASHRSFIENALKN